MSLIFLCITNRGEFFPSVSFIVVVVPAETLVLVSNQVKKSDRVMEVFAIVILCNTDLTYTAFRQ